MMYFGTRIVCLLLFGKTINVYFFSFDLSSSTINILKGNSLTINCFFYKALLYPKCYDAKCIAPLM